MCGIVGLLRLRPDAPPLDLEELRRSRDAMAARGPDGAGEWIAADGGVAFGHRRLAIIDLSAAGAQPMLSADGRYALTFNGEIYNHRELREELERDGVTFCSTSDSEVLLTLVARDGLAGIARLRGMYAFALWDGREKSLLLARDPFGIKPLYFSSDGATLRFASQVRALERGGGIDLAIDDAAVAAFLLWGSVPEPRTIRRAVRALPAGHALRIVEGRVGEPQRIPLAALRAEDAAEEPIAASVRAHLVADVPVAVFLSAGIDSALVAALARRHLPEPPVSFTLAFAGWEGEERDEAPLAAAVARTLGLRHVERRLGRDEVSALWPEALAAMDQPSIDGVNTFLVARLAHEAGIKVALSGLGGDELFGSYPSFREVPRWARTARRLARVPAATALWPGLARLAAKQRPKLSGLLRYGTTLPGAWFLRRGLFLPEELPAVLGAERASAALAEVDPVAEAARRLVEPTPEGAGWTGPWRDVQTLEASLYMRNQLLRDSDWAAMASSLELRVPLVDVPLWSALSRRDFEPAKSRGKAALARELAPELPEEVFTRPKTGFQVPVAEWMLGPAPGGLGHHSRRLARRVLAEWGVELGSGAGE